MCTYDIQKTCLVGKTKRQDWDPAVTQNYSRSTMFSDDRAATPSNAFDHPVIAT